MSPSGCGSAARAGRGGRGGKPLPPGWLATGDERMIRAPITMCLACAASGATGASKAATTPVADPLAIVGATLVNPDAPPVADAVVVVRDGRIVAAGPRDGVDIPAGARRVDAAGKWLVPGYVDTHVHFFQSGGLYAR